MIADFRGTELGILTAPVSSGALRCRCETDSHSPRASARPLHAALTETRATAITRVSTAETRARSSRSSTAAGGLRLSAPRRRVRRAPRGGRWRAALGLRRRVLRLLLHRRRGRAPHLCAPHVAAAPQLGARLLRPLRAAGVAAVPVRRAAARAARAAHARVTVVQHAREARKGINTVALLRPLLGPSLEVFQANFNEALPPALLPAGAVLLYPAPDAMAVDTAAGAARLRALVDGGERVTLVVPRRHVAAGEAAVPRVWRRAAAAARRLPGGAARRPDLPRHPPRARRGAAQHVRVRRRRPRVARGRRFALLHPHRAAVALCRAAGGRARRRRPAAT